MKDLVLYIVKALVDDPGQADVTETAAGASSLAVEIRVAADDRGKIIGRDGRIIKAIRALAAASAEKSGTRVSVEIVE